MAGEIRDLSKKLGNIRLKLHVKTVFLLTKAHDETLIEKTRDVAEWLLSKERDTPYIVYARPMCGGSKVTKPMQLRGKYFGA